MKKITLIVGSYHTEKKQNKNTWFSFIFDFSLVTHDWHSPRSQACFEGVFKNDSVKLKMVHCIGDLNDKVVQERLRTEKRLLTGWLPSALIQIKDHPGMK